MSRRCGWCWNPRRSELERRVLDGEPIRLVAQASGHSEAAAYRHLRAHLRPELVAALADSGVATSAADFAARAIDLLADTETARRRARATDDGRLLLLAVSQELAVLGHLQQRLGVTSTEILDDIEETKALARALLPVLSQHPSAAAELLGALDRDSQPELAGAIRSVLRGPGAEIAQPPNRQETA